MDFIERIFHISPDGGDGTTEAALIGVALLFLVGICFRKKIASVVRRCFSDGAPRDR